MHNQDAIALSMVLSYKSDVLCRATLPLQIGFASGRKVEEKVLRKGTQEPLSHRFRPHKGPPFFDPRAKPKMLAECLRKKSLPITPDYTLVIALLSSGPDQKVD